jgi:hypothetical protein
MLKRLLMLAIFATSVAAANEEVIGYVKKITGEATITTDGNTQALTVGSAVYRSSVLRTSARSSLGVTFKDETVMSFGPDTELAINEFLYAPAHGSLKLHCTLIRGTMNYLSGIIAKLRPEAVTVETRSGVIGVRGTQFAIKTGD